MKHSAFQPPPSGDGTGVIGDETQATLQLGQMFTDSKFSFAVMQIERLIGGPR